MLVRGSEQGLGVYEGWIRRPWGASLGFGAGAVGEGSPGGLGWGLLKTGCVGSCWLGAWPVCWGGCCQVQGRSLCITPRVGVLI